MKFYDFVYRLCNVSSSYRWSLKGKKVSATINSGPYKGYTLNPITALAHKAGHGVYENTREGSEQAASVIGIPRSFARSIYSATIGSKNRGNTQLIRGFIRSALEV